MERVFLLSVLFIFVVTVSGNPYEDVDDHAMHPELPGVTMRIAKDSAEQTAEYWQKLGKERVRNLLRQTPNLNQAKNIILFLGDGMSIPTLAASRIYKGQLEGKRGEESQLSFEEFPVTGLSKTYCVDSQVADSACSATAYLGGVKANIATIGVTAQVALNDCQKMQDNSTHVHSIAKLFTDNGKSAGIVTTTRVTHASPSGAFAHTANRNWESDANIKADGHDPLLCRDIAHQLIHGDPGKHFKVILGGGRRELIPNTTTDEEGKKGNRQDQRNLIKEWETEKAALKRPYEYVWNREQLRTISSDTEYLLGLFESDHCKYHLEVTNDMEPTFEEMVESAINVLSKDKKGFFLFAEGGRIDHAHHSTYARMALDETVEFSKGIERAVSMVDLEETLIVVTSDHAHTMSMSGYPSRGNPINGVMDRFLAEDGLKYLTLSYANGKGYRKEVDGKRVDVTLEDMDNTRFRNPALVPLDSETHGGDDVAVFAYGPWQHLFTGVYEQSSIPHMMTYASCLDKSLTPCKTFWQNNPILNGFSSH